MADFDTELGARLLKFTAEHPELSEPLALWMADKGTCEAVYPDAAKIFKKEFPNL